MSSDSYSSMMNMIKGHGLRTMISMAVGCKAGFYWYHVYESFYKNLSNIFKYYKFYRSIMQSFPKEKLMMMWS